MKNNPRTMSILTQTIEETAYSSAPSKLAKDAVDNIDRRFIVFRNVELPTVSSDSHYMQAGEAKKVSRNQTPGSLRAQALGLLAIADEREKQMEAEDEKLAPYRLDAMKKIFPDREDEVHLYTYTTLRETEKYAVDTIVDMAVWMDEMRSAITELSPTQVDLVTKSQ